ncbi:retron St85 family RNA-directed DNA polymerase [Enterobacter sp. ECC-019]|uniref:retron St85 family RNA-directed DNA polymerase n=1 Tax=Enterobacterales TaxID=91347 RepID=UPI0036FBB2AB
MKKITNFFVTSPFVEAWLQTTVPSVGELSTEQRVARIGHNLALITRSGPKMYKVYSIPKRNGGKRVIAHPAAMLKAFQRDLNLHLVSLLPVHNAATAYRVSSSVKTNAKAHASNPYLLKMDLYNFFNSIDVDIFVAELRRHRITLAVKDLLFIQQCTFWSPSKTSTGRLILSVGAPTSPLISNFVMYEFDNIIHKICESLAVTYTRYADDLFFSTNVQDVLFKIPDLVTYVLTNTYNGKFSTNQTKTRFSSKAHNRHVTGVTITNEGRLSLGRQRKRMISALIHQHCLKKLNIVETKKLQGLLSWASNIEPTFVISMRKKYSDKVIQSIISGNWNDD